MLVAMRPSLMEMVSPAGFDEVEVFGFGEGGDRTFHSGFGAGFPVAWSRSLDAEQRARLQELVRALPRGETMRCHTPPFGLRFGSGARERHVSICFACHNAYGAGELAAFNADSKQAKALLAFLKSLAPTAWPSSE